VLGDGVGPRPDNAVTSHGMIPWPASFASLSSTQSSWRSPRRGIVAARPVAPPTYAGPPPARISTAARPRPRCALGGSTRPSRWSLLVGRSCQRTQKPPVRARRCRAAAALVDQIRTEGARGRTPPRSTRQRSRPLEHRPGVAIAGRSRPRGPTGPRHRAHPLLYSRGGRDGRRDPPARLGLTCRTSGAQRRTTVCSRWLEAIPSVDCSTRCRFRSPFHGWVVVPAVGAVA